MVDAGRVVATLELDTGGFMDGIEGALSATRALSGGARSASGGVGALADAMAGLRGAAERGADGALEALNGLRAGAASAGRQAVNGLIAGAESRRGALVSKFKSLARSAIQAARDELGIASPSKVFAEIGANAARGFELGVGHGAESAQNTMRHLVSFGVLAPTQITGAGATLQSSSVVNNNRYDAPISVTFPNASVRSDNDIREIERRTQRLARDLQYGLGARP